MMSSIIDSVSKLVSPPSAPAESLPPGTLGKEDFMRLLIEQMKAQDPLNPQDPADFTAQLAQFSSLEQLLAVNNSLGSLGVLGSLNEQILATSSIGKLAHVNGESISVSDGQTTTISFNLPRDSTTTLLNVYNDAGGRVAQLNLGTLNAGDNRYLWNGLSESGSPVPAGTYRFEVAATDSAGLQIPAETQLSGIVTGVRFDGVQPMLIIGGVAYPMADIAGLDVAPQVSTV
jgi:flagellar basal-body rod modification protein FlgD